MTLQILGRAYQVEPAGTDMDKLPRYRVTGSRGGNYFTMRNRHQPDVLFLVNSRRFGMAPGRLSRVRLQEVDGELRQVVP
jgi:hypothetical protein